jgi:hypothetical protein
MKHYLFLFIFFFAVCNSSFADKGKGKIEVKISLRDGSIYKGTVKITEINLETDYGKLVIPFKSVNYIDVGITPDKSNKDKIINLAKKLSSIDFEERKSAYEKLSKLKVNEVPVLKDYIYSIQYNPDTIFDYSADGILDELESKYNLSGSISYNDVISLDYQYLIGGRYDFKKIDITTQFGTFSIPKEEILRIDVIFVPGQDSFAKTIIVKASKHITGNTSGGWLNTGIMVNTAQHINIIATGEVALQSLSGAKYSPDGAVNSSYQSTSNYPTYGNLVYKIGNNGTMTTAGSKYNGVATQSGPIYLSIYETVYNVSNTGQYIVKISIR